MSKIQLKICIVILLFSFFNSNAQELEPKFRSAGGMIGNGQLLSSGTLYKPIFLAGDLSWQFTRGEKKVFLSYYIQPQFNFVLTEGPVQVEFGNNVGIRLYQQAGKDLYFYQMLGAGPHFITAIVERQAKGFIFSDNIGIGVVKKMANNKVALNFQLIWRHLSNAGFKNPNAGINTLNILIGLIKLNGNQS